MADLRADREYESTVAGICQDAVHAGRLDPGCLAGLAAPHSVAYGAADAAKLTARLLGTAGNYGAGGTAGNYGAGGTAANHGAGNYRAANYRAANYRAVDAGEGA
ncbi:MAG: hypothetical protein QOJ73_3822 [Streptosporangiaceae bacterium]|nr:hypothetical protein [Streptosporangiaceae bacterium]